MKANCEACQVNSDSQFDHCRSGNCLDENLNQYEIYLAPAYDKIKIGTLMSAHKTKFLIKFVKKWD